MATPTPEAQIAAIETKMHQIYQMIATLEAHKGDTADIDCTWDIAHKKPLTYGQFARQCKNVAVYGTTPPLCFEHSKKQFLNLLADGYSEIMRLKKQPLRSNVEGADVHDPKTILVTGAEYEAFMKGDKTCVVDLKTTTGGIHGRPNAICKALATQNFTKP